MTVRQVRKSKRKSTIDSNLRIHDIEILNFIYYGWM